MNETVEHVCWFPLSRGKWTQVSLVDAARVAEYKWTLGEHTKNGHPYAYKTGGQRLHRFLTGVPPGVEVDHENSDPLDNRRENLRPCSHAQNGCNLTKWKTKTSSVYKGVTKHKQSGNWRAYIVLNGKQKHLGSFETQELAARAYDKEAREIFGEFAKPNFSSGH